MLQPGTQLGGFEIESQIGHGAMSLVYRARRQGSSRHVAIKVLLANLATQQGFVDRFKREARAVSMLAHRNIVALHEYGEHDGYVYLVMEYIPGNSLGQLLRARIPVERSVRYLMQLADALQYAHDLGIIHRDIKPGNLMIEEDTDRLVLMDFGFSKIAEESLQLTRPGTNLGTPHFMSPEQILGKPVDGRTDIYAAGIVLYQLATGKLPFAAENGNAVAVLKRVLQDPMPSPRLEVPSLPVSLERVILTATSKARESRYPDARAFKEALAACAATLPSSPSRPLVLAGSVVAADAMVTADHVAEMQPLLAGAAAHAPSSSRAPSTQGPRTVATAGAPPAPLQASRPPAIGPAFPRAPMAARHPGLPATGPSHPAPPNKRPASPAQPSAPSSRSLLSVRPSPLSQPPATIPEQLLATTPDVDPSAPSFRRGFALSPNVVALLVVAAIVAVAFFVVVVGRHL